MAIVVPDIACLREPNLLIPGKKPVGNVKIDWDHPVTNELKICVLSPLGNSVVDLAGGRWEMLGGGYETGIISENTIPSHQRSRGSVNIGYNLYYGLTPYKLSSPTVARTVIADVVFPNTTYTDARYLIGFGSIASGKRWTIRTDSTTFKLRLELYDGYKIFDTPALNGNRSTIAVASPANSGSVDALGWVNGVKYSEYGSLSITINTTTNTPLLFSSTGGTKAGGFGYSKIGGKLNWLMFFERVLSDEEVLSITHDPYQFLIPA